MEKKDYDVAISFLYPDVQLAQDIASKISQKYENVFTYLREQDKLVGEDGIDFFSNVFQKYAKTVIILYRPNWGNTKWTKIEETAIKSRWYEGNQDFLLLIPLEGNEIPDFYPKYRIYFDKNILDLDDLMPIVENHLERNIDKKKKSSLEEIVSTVDQDLEHEKRLSDYLWSPKARQDFLDEIDRLINLFKSRIEEINNNSSNIYFDIELIRQNGHKILYKGNELAFFYQAADLRKSPKSLLVFKLYKNRHDDYYNESHPAPKKLNTKEYQFSIDKQEDFIWISNQDKPKKSEQIVEDELERLIRTFKD